MVGAISGATIHKDTIQMCVLWVAAPLTTSPLKSCLALAMAPFSSGHLGLNMLVLQGALRHPSHAVVTKPIRNSGDVPDTQPSCWTPS